MRSVSDLTFLSLYSTCHFLVHIPSKVLAALIIIILNHFNLSLVQYGLIATSVGMAEGFSSPICGILADKFDKRQFPPLSIALTGIATLIIGLIGKLSVIIFICSLLIISFTSALFHAPGMTMISERFPKGRSKAFSIFSIGGQAGMGVGPLTVAFLLWIGEGELEDPFIAYLIWSIPILIVSVIMIYTHSRDPNIGISIETINIPKSDLKVSSSYSSVKMLLISSFLILILITAAIGFGRKLFDQYLVYFLVTVREIPEASAVFYYSMLTILGLPGNFLGGIAGDKYGEVPILMIAHSLTVFGLIILVLFSNPLFLPLIVGLLAFGKNIAMPNSHSLTARLVPIEARGKAYGLIRWDVSVGGSIAPTIGAAIYTRTNPLAIFIISIGLFIIAIILYSLLRTPKRKDNIFKIP